MKKPKPTNKEKLEKDTTDLTKQLMMEFGRLNLWAQFKGRANDAELSNWLFDERPYPLASSIIETLGESSLLEERDVIYLITISFFLQLASESKVDANQLDGTALVNKIVDRLCSPERSPFSVSISAMLGLPLEFDIGGTHQLKIENPATEEDRRVVLSGLVDAIHEQHGARLIQADVKALIGASISMGIAEPLPVAFSYETPVITLPHWTIDSVPLEPSVAGLVNRIRFVVPGDLNELESKRLGNSDATPGAPEHRLRGVRNVLAIDSQRGRELCSAARLLFDAFAATEAGAAIAFSFMSMEAVLLDADSKADLLARLKEAVAYRLGKSADQRKHLRSQVSRLYDARSGFVHTGKVDKASTSVNEARHMSASVLRLEILDFDSGVEYG